MVPDHCPFFLEGVPVLNHWVDTTRYREIHHRAGDTYETIDPPHLKVNAAMVVATACALAERPERIAPRLPGAEVERLFTDAGLDAGVIRDLWRP